MFLKWREAIDTGAMKEPEKSAFRYCLTRINDEFHLYCSLRRDSLQSVKHPLPPPYSPLPKASGNNDDDEEEEAFSADDNDDESDPDFLPKK